MRTKKKLLATSKLWSTNIVPNNTPLRPDLEALKRYAPHRSSGPWLPTSLVASHQRYWILVLVHLHTRSLFIRSVVWKALFHHCQTREMVHRVRGKSQSVSTVNRLCAVAILLPHWHRQFHVCVRFRYIPTVSTLAATFNTNDFGIFSLSTLFVLGCSRRAIVSSPDS